MIKKIIFCIYSIALPFSTFAQREKTDANIIGHVVKGDEHLPYVTILIKGTTIGTLTDATGHYQLVNLPMGTLTIAASAVGFKTIEKKITIEQGKTIEVHFEMEDDVFRLDEVVVSADKNEQRRSEAPIIVNTITPKLFVSTESQTLSDGLKFCPGLRMENNCQNCGFNQVRMNGMEGAYSQILINSRPIFSGLAGVYGLELIPSNMLERVEIVRGGGSAIYGSNAIAGTINLILKDPDIDSYEVGMHTGLTGIGMSNVNPAPEHAVNLNTSHVSADRKTGFSLYGFNRQKNMFDANNDGFSESSEMKNMTIGSRLYHRFSDRNKITADFFSINENRNGGNRLDYPHHQRDISEAVEHDVKNISLNYDQYLREYDLLSIYASTQILNRDSYYGANRSLNSYGNSKDLTYNIGSHYKMRFKNASLVSGIENTGNFLKDKKLGYPDYSNAVIINDSITEVPQVENTLVANQSSLITGIFTQYEIKVSGFKIAVGARYDNYRIENFSTKDKKNGNVFSPRLSMMYKISCVAKIRLSYSRGYRAPQIFDEDLHILTSGSRRIIHINDPTLKQETSNSYMASMDISKVLGTVNTNLLIEGFYTQLNNPFYNQIGLPDESGTVTYTRVNAVDGAMVAGLNLELKIQPIPSVMINSGMTFQNSRYDKAQDFNENHFFRTPDSYGFLLIDYFVNKKIIVSTTGNYTGKMLVPYFGPNTNPSVGELRQSNPFYDAGLKISYKIKINDNKMQFFVGMKNIFNSYQNDFDSGIDRDPAYMYGPSIPRTIYAGIKIGNLL